MRRRRNAEFVLQPAVSISSNCWVNIPEERTTCLATLSDEDQVQEVLTVKLQYCYVPIARCSSQEQ